jgi:hypothetical protein
VGNEMLPHTGSIGFANGFRQALPGRGLRAVRVLGNGGLDNSATSGSWTERRPLEPSPVLLRRRRGYADPAKRSRVNSLPRRNLRTDEAWHFDGFAAASV